MQQSPQSGKVVTANERKTAQVFSVRTDIMMRSEDTGGTYSSYEIIAPPECGARAHTHSHENENMYVIEGTFHFRCGEQECTLGAGDSIYMPKGLPHSFINTGQTTGRLLGVATPAGLERFFEDVDEVVRVKQADLTRADIAAVCRRHGIEILPQ